MNITRKIPYRPLALGLLVLGFSAIVLGRAQAGGSHYFPPVADPLVKEECGSCHLAFAPSMLPASSWQRMMADLVKHKADIAVASSGGNTHPVFCLCKKEVLPSLQAYITQGGRKVSAWQKSLRYIEVDFSDCSDAFVNLNTFEDLAALAFNPDFPLGDFQST